MSDFDQVLESMAAFQERVDEQLGELRLRLDQLELCADKKKDGITIQDLIPDDLLTGDQGCFEKYGANEVF